MSKRLNLREFQQRLSSRLQEGDAASSRVSTLGLQIAGENWLVDMNDISEVLPLPPLTPAPLTKPWFRGVANIRGNIYSVVDLAAYQHGGAASGDIHNRVLLVAGRYAFNSALLVDRVLGLRDAKALQQDAKALQQNDVNGKVVYQDEQGKAWHMLDVKTLLEQAEFLQIGI